MIKKKNFSLVPNCFYDAVRDLSPKAIKVYLAICRFYNNKTKMCYPSAATIAGLVKLSERRVMDGVKELVEKGCITKKSHGYKGKSNVYMICGPKEQPVQERVIISQEQSVNLSGTEAANSHEQTVPYKYINKYTIDQENQMKKRTILIHNVRDGKTYTNREIEEMIRLSEAGRINSQLATARPEQKPEHTITASADASADKDNKHSIEEIQNEHPDA